MFRNSPFFPFRFEILSAAIEQLLSFRNVDWMLNGRHLLKEAMLELSCDDDENDDW